MKRSQLALVALAVLAVVGLWLLLDKSPVRNVDARPAPTVDTPRTESGAALPSAASDTAPAEEQRAVIAAADTGESAIAQASTAKSPAAAWGRLVLVDELGRESLEDDGVLTVACRSASGGFEELRAPVRSGAWRLELTGATLTEGAELEFRHVLVGARRLRILAPTTDLPCTAAQDVVVRARRPARTLLRVTDASSKLDLQNVELVRSDSALEAQHPGLSFDEKVIARARVSPLEIDELQDAEFGPRQRLFVGARGYAWQALELDLETGGERVAALTPGADLSLVVRGVDPSSGAVLRFRRAETRAPLLTLPLPRDDALELRDLPAQLLSVSAEVGDGLTAEPPVLGQIDVDLSVAKSVSAELILSKAPTTATAAVRGTLYAPRDWRLEAPTLLFRARDSALAGGAEQLVNCSRSDSDREGFEAFAFSVEAVPVGRCELVLFDPNYSVLLDVPPAGLEGVEFVLPQLAQVEFELLDSQTGERASDVRLAWQSVRPPGVTAGESEWATLLSDGLHGIRAPAGEIKLMTLTNHYEPYEATVRVAPGDARRVISLARACTIQVRLSAGGTALSLPKTWSATPSAVEGKGEVLSTRRSGKALNFVVSTPGTYEVRPDPIPGYRTPAPQRVDVQRGASAAIEFVYEIDRP